MAAKKCCKYCKRYGYEHIKVLAGSFCDFDCASRYGAEKAVKEREKAFKKSIKADKQKHTKRKREFYDNDRSYRAKQAQTSFNAYIRGRDKGLPCISCGNMPNSGAYVGGSGVHAGHYLSVGAHPELRFEEANCSIQCVNCNVHNSGNIAKYRMGLLKKYGHEKVEWLEGPHDAKKYTCADLKDIEEYFKAKLKELPAP
jgi:hypothetical protein